MSALGVLAGVPTSTISRIESGRIEPTLGMIRRIALGAGFHLSLECHEVFAGPVDEGVVAATTGEPAEKGEMLDGAAR